ncbi:MAG: hypothetical protein ACOX2F_10375 [bacterium]
MKKIVFLFLIVSLVFFVSCGGDNKKENEKDGDENGVDNEATDDETGNEEPNEDGKGEDEDKDDDKEKEDGDDDKVETVPLKCEDFAEGMNSNLIVGDLERDFILKLPENVETDGPWPVIFIWHGYGGSASEAEKMLSGKINNSEMPFILVAPVARSDIFTFGIPPKGLDWDMINLADGSAEADMFDAVVGCIDEKWGVDEDHIHVTGFSAGAITASSIALLRPEVVASALTYSGAYFSDPESREALGEIMNMKVGDFFSWPDMEEEHTKYTHVLVSGEEGSDTWGTMGFTIDFNIMANFATDYLNDLGHDIILCNHGSGHIVAGPSSDTMIKFFSDHPFGTEDSPYSEELPDGYDTCEFKAKAD